MQGFGAIKRGPIQISWGQPYPRGEVFEPNHLGGNRGSTHLKIGDEEQSDHEPPVISSIVVHRLGCTAGWVVAEEPHI